MKTKVFIAMVIVIIAFCVVGSIVLFAAESTKEREIENGVLEQEVDETKATNAPIPTTAVVCQDSPVSTPSPTAAKESQTTPTVAPVAENVAIASIKIDTDKKTRTYVIMDGVSEKILKYNIGHLPSSTLPGKEGVCVLMGHRDTDFSILQYVKVGDEFSVLMGGEVFEYEVNGIEIVESDSELRFTTIKGKNLVLVTCYPFRYSGHAPKKYVVYCEMIN